MLKAVTRQASLVDARIRALNADPARRQHPVTTAHFFDHFATPEDVAVTVTEQDFLDAHRELIPSVSAGELAHYERVRATFESQKKDGENDSGKESGAPARLGLAGGRRGAANKGKGKSPVGKGKGKAIALGSDDEADDGNEGGYDGEPGGEGVDGDGGVRDKGKGKEVAVAVAAPFGDGVGSGDEGLYE